MSITSITKSPNIESKTSWSKDTKNRVGKSDKINKSSFIITVNTNQNNEKYFDKLKFGWEYISNNLKEFLIYKPKTDKDKEWSKIIDIKMNVTTEVGKKYGQVHLHAVVDISHRTWLRIDLPRLNEAFRRALGLSGININVSVLRPNMDLQNALMYITKDL